VRTPPPGYSSPTPQGSACCLFSTMISSVTDYAQPHLHFTNRCLYPILRFIVLAQLTFPTERLDAHPFRHCVFSGHSSHGIHVHGQWLACQ
jgi:hypothetical protein